MSSTTKLRVAIVGATGIAGQQFIDALRDHPWFEITALAASERSAGSRTATRSRDAKSGAVRWWCADAPPPAVTRSPGRGGRRTSTPRPSTSSSRRSRASRRASSSRVGRSSRPVFSTASAYRYEEDVPLLIPASASSMRRSCARSSNAAAGRASSRRFRTARRPASRSRSRRCTAGFGVERVAMTSMQGISGAGRSPGVVALDILDNVVPYIPGEEEKVAKETAKILGALGRDAIEPGADRRVGDLHPRRRPRRSHRSRLGIARARVLARGRRRGDARVSGRHRRPPVGTAPHADRPRRSVPTAAASRSRRRRRHDDLRRRLRPDALWTHGLRFVLVSHNTKFGAAKGAVLLAEALQPRRLSLSRRAPPDDGSGARHASAGAAGPTDRTARTLRRGAVQIMAPRSMMPWLNG